MKKITIPRLYRLFFLTISLVAIITGAIFYFKLNLETSNLKVTIDTFFLEGGSTSFFSLFLFNFILVFLIWIFGLSVFGSVFITFIYFFKVFILSINVASIFTLEETKPALRAFLYVFPNQVLSLFVYALIAIYAVNFSFLFSKSILGKNTLMNRYLFKTYNCFFLIMLAILFLNVLYQSFINPFIINLVFN